MKIIVKSVEEKQILLEQSRYIHDFFSIRRSRTKVETSGLDSDKAGTLMHIYTNPDMIIVDPIAETLSEWNEEKLEGIKYQVEEFLQAKEIELNKEINLDVIGHVLDVLKNEDKVVCWLLKFLESNKKHIIELSDDEIITMLAKLEYGIFD